MILVWFEWWVHLSLIKSNILYTNLACTTSILWIHLISLSGWEVFLSINRLGSWLLIQFLPWRFLTSSCLKCFSYNSDELLINVLPLISFLFKNTSIFCEGSTSKCLEIWSWYIFISTYWCYLRSCKWGRIFRGSKMRTIGWYWWTLYGIRY